MDGERVLVTWYELQQGCMMLRSRIAALAFVHSEMNTPLWATIVLLPGVFLMALAWVLFN